MQKLLLILSCCFLYHSLHAQPMPCGNDPAMTSTCLDACVICDIDGFTGRNNLAIQGQAFPGFCTTFPHNMSYISFIAGTEELTIEVTVDNCTINTGLEIGIFESFDCQTFSPVSICNTNVFPNTTVPFSNLAPLVVGQHYYLIMDGSAGDICDWTFNVVEGSTAVGVLTTSGVISGTPETCSGLPTTYTTSGDIGAVLFNWRVNGVLQSSSAQEIDITFASDGTYELCVTAANVCDEAPPTCTTIEVISPETLTVEETLCFSECLEIGGETLCESGNYDLVVTLPNGCDSLIFVNLTILPASSSFIDINLCVGEEFFVGNTSYSTTGVFVETIQTSQLCDSLVTLDLFMIECEIIGSTDFTPPICNGDATGSLFFSIENGTPPFAYNWSNINNTTIQGNSTTNLFINNQIENVPAGVYEINIMDNFGNDVVLFQEITEPSVLTMTNVLSDFNGFNLACHDATNGSISSSGNGGIPPYIFDWSNNQSGTTITNLPIGLYTVTLTDASGCEEIQNITLTAPEQLQFIANYINPSCDGLTSGSIQIDSIWGGITPYFYALNNDTFALNSNFKDLGTGQYDLSIKDANQCLSDTSGNLKAPDIPIIFLEEKYPVDLGCDVLLPAVTNNISLAAIQWSNPDLSVNCDTCLRTTVQPVINTQYMLTVTSDDGCSTSDSTTVMVNKLQDIFVPNVFSPNGDGANDYFFINTSKSVHLIKEFRIFNRWGGLVYEKTDIPPNHALSGWNGLDNNQRMNKGVYIWIATIEYLDGEIVQLSGDVTLLL